MEPFVDPPLDLSLFRNSFGLDELPGISMLPIFSEKEVPDDPLDAFAGLSKLFVFDETGVGVCEETKLADAVAVINVSNNSTTPESEGINKSNSLTRDVTLGSSNCTS